MNIKELFDLSVQTNVPVFYHADGESCKAYTTEELITIYTALSTNKFHHITYYNQLKMYVESLDNIDDVKWLNMVKNLLVNILILIMNL